MFTFNQKILLLRLLKQEKERTEDFIKIFGSKENPTTLQQEAVQTNRERLIDIEDIVRELEKK